jgi:hypothetical protein
VESHRFDRRGGCVPRSEVTPYIEMLLIWKATCLILRRCWRVWAQEKMEWSDKLYILEESQRGWRDGRIFLCVPELLFANHSHDVDVGRRRTFVEHSWAGNAPSSVLPSPRSLDSPVVNVHQNSHKYRVHRIKVDEKAGIILTTSQVGGLLVRDLESDEVLWELPVVRASHSRTRLNLTFVISGTPDRSPISNMARAMSSSTEQMETKKYGDEQ